MIEVQRAIDATGYPSDDQFRCWAAAVRRRFDLHGEVTVRLVDEAESRALNSRFRSKDAPTNVLSFPLQVSSESGESVLGDLAICAPLVEREAREQHKEPHAHWAHLLVHGLLHLAGYDHAADDEAERMEALERDILHELDFPNPYERTS